MKFFALYGAARLALFAAVFAVLWLVVGRNVEANATNLLFLALLALAVSALIALLALRSLRDKAAVEMGRRAAQMRDAFERSKAKEDVD